MFSNAALGKELQDIAKLQKKCTDKYCKKESGSVQKQMKEVQHKMDQVSNTIQKGMLSVQSGKMKRNDYMTLIQKEIKKGFKIVHDFIHSKEVYASTKCALTHCDKEVRESLHAIAKFLKMVCDKGMMKGFDFICITEKEITKLEKKETITTEAYISIITTMAQKAEKAMTK